MARATHKMSGGLARVHACDHPYFLQTVSMNPYVGTVHDGVSTNYGEGFSSKPIPFLYRFRFNILPQGQTTGFYCRNPQGKFVHWLEVSTIEKVRIRAVSEEALPIIWLMTLTVLFTAYHLGRLAFFHPDLTLYNLAIFTTKPWVTQMRFSKAHPMDQPIFRYVTRVPELGMEDPIRDMYAIGVIANDPYQHFLKSIGKEHELLVKPETRGWGEGSAGKLLPRTDMPASMSAKTGHNPGFM